MTPVADITELEAAFALPIADGPVATLEGPRSPESSRPHRCPRCGHVEHTDSEIAGTCVLCPGLVELEPA